MDGFGAPIAGETPIDPTGLKARGINNRQQDALQEDAESERRAEGGTKDATPDGEGQKRLP